MQFIIMTSYVQIPSTVRVPSCASPYHLPALVPFRLHPTRSLARRMHNSHMPSTSRYLHRQSAHVWSEEGVRDDWYSVPRAVPSARHRRGARARVAECLQWCASAESALYVSASTPATTAMMFWHIQDTGVSLGSRGTRQTR